MSSLAYKLIGAGVAALALLLLYGWLYVANANLRADNAALKLSVASCTSENKAWADATNAANAQVQALKDVGDARAKTAAQAVTDANKLAQKYDALAKTLAAATPKDVDDCKATRLLVDEYLRDRP